MYTFEGLLSLNIDDPKHANDDHPSPAIVDDSRESTSENGTENVVENRMVGVTFEVFMENLYV